MALPSQGQSVHMMNWFGVLQVLWRMWRKEGRNVAELALYTTDHLGRSIKRRTGIPSSYPTASYPVSSLSRSFAGESGGRGLDTVCC